jgi:hypothetical protein
MIDDKDAIKSLKDTETQAKKSTDAMKSLGDGAAKLGKAFVAGAAIAGGALIALTGRVVESTSAIDDASQRVGMSAEEYQKWAYAAKLSGIEVDKLENAMKKQQTVFANATEGNKAAGQAYKDLGIDIKGLTAGDAFNQAITALANMEDETKRNSLANDLFGKSYADLAPLLNTGSEGIEKLKQDAVDLGGVMSNEAVAGGALMGDTLDSIKFAVEGAAAQVATNFMPTIQKFLDWVLVNMPTIQTTITTVLDAVVAGFTWVSDNANWLIPVLAGVVGGFVAFQIISGIVTLFSLLSTVVAGASGVMAIFNIVMSLNPIGLVVLAIAGLIAIGVALWMNWDTVVEKAKGLWNKIKEIFGGIRDFIKGVFDKIRDFIKIPSISITGSLNPLDWLKNGIPKFNVNWNAQGGIFTKPTIFDTRSGFQGVGEAGPEAIMPLSKLDSMLSENNKGIVVNFYPQSMSESELDNTFNYINRRFGMEL